MSQDSLCHSAQLPARPRCFSWSIPLSLEHPRLRIGRKIPVNPSRKTGRSFTAFPSLGRERRTDAGRCFCCYCCAPVCRPRGLVHVYTSVISGFEMRNKKGRAFDYGLLKWSVKWPSFICEGSVKEECKKVSIKKSAGSPSRRPPGPASSPVLPACPLYGPARPRPR